MYRLIGRLEQGELADLFRAERVASGERVVVKLFHPRTTDAAYARVVSATTIALKPLEHQRIAHVLEVGLVQRRLAIVREDVGRFTVGLVLQRLHTREVVLPPALALTFVLELLEVLGRAHQQGVVHGALTPGNVLVGDDGRPSLAEFGALRALQASDLLRTAFGPRGRTSYRAPELKTAAAEATVAADVYAIGAMTYELLTLREASLDDASVRTRPERLPPPSRLVRRLHARLDPVIMRALEPTPGRRYHTCEEFVFGLREFLSAQGGIPAREDLGKFVSELFPNEVSATALGPVPFAEAFTLEPIAEVSASDAAPIEVSARAPFSGGEIDVKTMDDLPVIDELAVRPTQLELAAVAGGPAAAAQPQTWDAPGGVLPPAPSADEGTNADVLKRRLRALEALAAPNEEEAVVPRRDPVKQAPPPKKTVLTFAVNFKREGDPEVPNLELMLARSKQQARVAARIATVVLFATVGGLGASWYRSTRDPRAALLSYLPAPVQRELTPRHPPATPPGPALTPKVTLPIFPEPRNVPHTDVCYAVPLEGRTATFTVTAKRNVRVEVDGRLVCDSTPQIVVSAGRHTVRFIDGQDVEALVREFKGGSTLTLVPFKASP